MEQHQNEEFTKKILGTKLFTFLQQEFSTLRERNSSKNIQILSSRIFPEMYSAFSKVAGNSFPKN